jgi:glutamine amidotransferase
VLPGGLDRDKRPRKTHASGDAASVGAGRITMARMFGFIGNRADLGARVLELHKNVLRVRSTGEGPLGWGIGFYQSGEVLLRRRPIDDRAVIEMADAAGAVRTDVLIGHVRRATVGGLCTENTHPFRYRS